MLEVGVKAPDFELPDQNGKIHRLSDYTGKKVILYFYPKDNTAGCTKQACGFSERYPQFTEKGAVILGVSKDSVSSHKRFEEKLKTSCADTLSVTGIHKDGVIVKNIHELSGNALIKEIMNADIEIASFDSYRPSLNDIFVKAVGGDR